MRSVARKTTGKDISSVLRAVVETEKAHLPSWITDKPFRSSENCNLRDVLTKVEAIQQDDFQEMVECLAVTGGDEHLGQIQVILDELKEAFGDDINTAPLAKAER